MVVSVSLLSCVSAPDENGKTKSIAYCDQISDNLFRATGEPVHAVIARFALGYNPQDRTVLDAIRENRTEIASLLTNYFKEKTAKQMPP